MYKTYLWYDLEPLVEYSSRVILFLQFLQPAETGSVNSLWCLITMGEVGVSQGFVSLHFSSCRS